MKENDQPEKSCSGTGQSETGTKKPMTKSGPAKNVPALNSKIRLPSGELGRLADLKHNQLVYRGKWLRILASRKNGGITFLIRGGLPKSITLEDENSKTQTPHQSDTPSSELNQNKNQE
jgi:hypothetical protein